MRWLFRREEPQAYPPLTAAALIIDACERQGSRLRRDLDRVAVVHRLAEMIEAKERPPQLVGYVESAFYPRSQRGFSSHLTPWADFAARPNTQTEQERP